jgi:2',3'-cyclic-nucleotide 2'-phosphodiesterase/3'-nucleotidase
MTHITAKLRILATTDLHMNLSGFDYASDAPGGTTGLAGLSTMVTAARAEARLQGRSSILLDNGDFLQGTALADWQSELGTAPEHPLIRILNAMEYDAIGLGNHDLDYGTGYLADVIGQLDAPAVSTNLSSGIIAGLHPVRAAC